MKKSVFISLLGLIQLCIAFSYQILILNLFGFNEFLDIFYASSTIHFIIVAISANSINFAITPIFVNYFKHKKMAQLKEAANTLFNSIFLLFFFFAILQFFFAETISNLIFPGFSQEKIMKTSRYLKVFGFLSILTISGAVLKSLFYTFEYYYSTIWISIIGILFQFAIVFFTYTEYSLDSLLIAITFNEVLVFLFLFSYLFKYYEFKLNWRNSELLHHFSSLSHLVFSSSFSKSNLAIDRFFASTVASGTITLLHYGQQIVQTISSFLNRGISLVSLRQFSIYSDEPKKFANLFLYVNKVILFITIPVIFSIPFFFNESLKIILFSDQLSSNDVNNLYLIILSLLGIILGGNLSSVITNAFYAQKKTALISRINIKVQIIGIVLKLVLFYFLGFWGLPLAFSITSLILVVYLYLMYVKYIGKIDFYNLFRYSGKIIIITIISAIIPKMISLFFLSYWLTIIITQWILFLGIYSFLVLRFENDISHRIINRVSLKIHWVSLK